MYHSLRKVFYIVDCKDNGLYFHLYGIYKEVFLTQLCCVLLSEHITYTVFFCWNKHILPYYHTSSDQQINVFLFVTLTNLRTYFTLLGAMHVFHLLYRAGVMTRHLEASNCNSTLFFKFFKHLPCSTFLAC